MKILSAVIVLCFLINGFKYKCTTTYVAACEKVSDIQIYGEASWEAVVVESILTNNSLYEIITEETFTNVPNLQRLSIVGQINQTELPRVLNLRKLTQVKISGNFIPNVNFDAFPKGLPATLDLNLSSNAIENVEHGPFQNYSIYSLDLSHNRLKKLESNMIDIPNLKKLTISYNQIDSISLYCFHPDVEYLDLSHNSLWSGHTHFAHQTTNFNELNLSHNKLSFVPVINASENIIFLDVSHNEIETLQPGTFNYFFALKTLNLSYNRLKYFNTYMIAKEDENLKFKIRMRYPDQIGMNFDPKKIYVFEEWSVAGNPWTCSYLEQIEDYFREMGIAHSQCDVKFFGNGESPACITTTSAADEFISRVIKYEEC